MVGEKESLEIDKELISLVEYKTDLSAEEIVDSFLRALVHYDDKDSKVIKDFVKTSTKLEKLKIKLAEQVKARNNSYDKKLVDKAMNTLERINENHGFLGFDEISNVAKMNKVSAVSLESLCIENNWEIRQHGLQVK
jgi:ATP-dependent protease HslVU (ClpYQ) ATPase subunit